MSVHPHRSIELFTTTVDGGPHCIAFLHGLFGQGRNFTQIAKALAPEATSLLVDLPDHGKSAWTPRLDLDEYADRVAPELEAFAPDGRLCLVGHSLGGKVAMRLALRRPELVERLCVVDISPRAGGLGGTFPHLIAALRTIDLATLASRADADRHLAPAIPDDVVRGFLLQNLRHEHGIWRWQLNLDVLSRDLAAVGGWPEISASFDGPVLWVAGQRSDYIRPEFAPAMRELFPRVRTVTVKNAGHWVHSEQPEAFVAILEQFVTA